MYTVAVMKEGFQILRQHGLEVNLGSEIAFNPKLTPSEAAETVDV